MWWFVWLRRAELLRACCAKWLGTTRLRGVTFLNPKGGGGGFGRRRAGRGVAVLLQNTSAGGGGVMVDELMKPADDVLP